MRYRDPWSVDPRAEAGPWFVGSAIAVVLVALAVWPTSQQPTVSGTKAERAAVGAPAPITTSDATTPSSLTPFTVPLPDPSAESVEEGETASDSNDRSSMSEQTRTSRTVSRSIPPIATQVKATATTLPPSRPPAAVPIPVQVQKVPTATTTTSASPPSTTTSTRRRGLLG